MLLKTFIDTPVPEPPWILPGLVTTGRTLVFGRPKVGKSYWSVQLAESLAAGTPFMDWAPTRPYRVTYVSLDTPRHTFREQLIQMGAQPGAILLCQWDEVGDAHAIPRFFLDTPKGVQTAKSVFTATEPEVVIFDGLTYLSSDLDVTDGNSVKRLYSRLHHVWGGPHVVLAHANKGSSEGDSRHPVERLKGGVELTADCDTYIFLEYETDFHGKPVVCRWSIGGRMVEERVVKRGKEASGRWVGLPAPSPLPAKGPHGLTLP